MLRRIRTKPVEKETIQFNGLDDYLEIIEWIKASNSTFADECGYSTPEMHIQTLEGRMSARPGDWIVKGLRGEFYPIKPDIFEKTYDFVDPKGPETP